MLRGYKHREGFQICYLCHRTSWWSWEAQFPEGQQGKLSLEDNSPLRPNRNHYT